MRKTSAFTAILLAGFAFVGAAMASPTVDITIGAELQKKSKTYGPREITYLSSDLQHSIESMSLRHAALQGAQFKLVIVDAKPNRPTFQQLGDTIGLSMFSIGVGGATLDGSVTYPGGRIQPVKYSWYNYNITDAVGSTTWTAAERAFDMFVFKVARDGAVTTR